jgi:hypothetical protein
MSPSGFTYLGPEGILSNCRMLASNNAIRSLPQAAQEICAIRKKNRENEQAKECNDDACPAVPAQSCSHDLPY